MGELQGLQTGTPAPVQGHTYLASRHVDGTPACEPGQLAETAEQDAVLGPCSVCGSGVFWAPRQAQGAQNRIAAGGRQIVGPS
jgi:hypothetical protein